MRSSEELSKRASVGAGQLIVSPSAPITLGRPAVLLPAGAVLAAIAGFVPSFSWQANAFLIVIGGGLFWAGVARAISPVAPPVRRLPAATAWWLIPGLGFAAVEAVNYVYGTVLRAEYAHPTLSLMADPLLERYLIRATLFGAWLAAFWGMVRR